MGQPVAIIRTEHTAAELRSQAVRSDDADQARRLLAIAMILDGVSRADAARQAGMDRQTLRDWVHRYNQQDVDGLISRKSPGAAGKLTEAQMSEVRQWVLDGPVERRFAVTVAKRTMVKWLRKWRFTRLQPRPYHPKKDAAAQEASKKTSVSA
jgi:transposase